MILITGATGTIGRALTSDLRARDADVRAMTRDPARAREILGETIHTVRGDFTDPPSLAAALHGVDTLFLLTAPGPSVADHDQAMMSAAKATGVKKVVKLSAFGADAPPPLLKASSWHREGEEAVMESGLTWTILRPAAFASNALGWAPIIRSRGVIEVATAGGKHACVDPRDVAAVAARALTSRDLDNTGLTLTGPEPLSTGEQIAIIAGALGRDIAVEDVTLDVMAARMRARGVPEMFVEAAVEGLGFVRDGRAAETSDAVERALGRPPRRFAEWVRDHLSLLG